jgi:hypothetical protein
MATPGARKFDGHTVGFYHVNAGYRSFHNIQIPDNVQVVQLSDNLLIDFQGFEPIPSIQSIALDRNPLLSFRAFPVLPELTSLSLIGSPLSELPNFRALAYVCAGPQLTLLNGTEITSADQANAAAYGDLARPLITRGWLPRKPISLRASVPSPTRQRLVTSIGVTSPKRAVEVKPKLLKVVEQHETDPISLQMVRCLREISCDTLQIRSFFRGYFTPYEKPRPEHVPEKVETPADVQVLKQRQIIEALAVQVQALRTGNRLFKQYNELVLRVASPLLDNADWVRSVEKGEKQVKAKEKKVVSDYGALRDAVITYLDAEPDTPDRDLLSQLNEIAVDEEEELDEEASPSFVQTSPTAPARTQRATVEPARGPESPTQLASPPAKTAPAPVQVSDSGSQASGGSTPEKPPEARKDEEPVSPAPKDEAEAEPPADEVPVEEPAPEQVKADEPPEEKATDEDPVPEQVKDDEPPNEKATDEEPAPEQVKADEPPEEKATDEEPAPEVTPTEEAVPEDAKDEAGAEEPPPDQPIPEDTKDEDTTPAEATAEEPTTEEAADEPPPDEPKGEEPAADAPPTGEDGEGASADQPGADEPKEEEAPDDS